MQTQAIIPASPQRPPRINPNLHIRLLENLSNSFERAIAWIVAKHLAERLGQPISIFDLVGFSLFVWSETPIQDSLGLAQYIQSDRPLQGLLMRERSQQPELSSSPKLLAEGLRLELAIAD
jgi:hypothetical protein